MRVLIFTAATGGGHMRTSKAMESYLTKYLPDTEVKIIDAIKEVNKLVDKIICGGYEFMAMKTPRLYGFMYNQTQKESLDISRPLSAMACGELMPIIQEFNPDVIITTHPFAGEMVSSLKSKGKVNVPLVSIMTDYGPHRAYLSKRVDEYIVPAPDCVEAMVKLGVAEKKIHPFGIPVFEVFHPAEKEEVPAIREKLGLIPDPDLPTILLMAGSFGVTNILEIYKELMARPGNFQLVIITGKNQKLYDDFQKVTKNAPKPVSLVYFTDVVQEYMQCSDLLVTKPGGLTVSEAIACDLPMVLFQAIPGQEEDNAAFLTRKGMAVQIGKNQSAAEVICELVNHPEKLHEMRQNVHELDTSGCRKNLGRLLQEVVVKNTGKPLPSAEDCCDSQENIIYLDNSATTRVCDEAAEKVLEMMVSNFGNPSSIHQVGFAAEKEMSEAREAIAKMLGAKSSEITFTSGGTEANNLAIFGAVQAKKRSGNKIVTTAVEHPSVAECMNQLEKDGFEIVRLPVDAFGRVSEEAVLEAIDEKTILVSMMMVNNEVGAIQPVEAAAKAILRKKAPALLHVDAVQAFGKLPIKVNKLKIDLLSISGHKVQAPKGVGALYIKDGVRILPRNFGGGQEKGIRSGTEAVPAICGFGAAVKTMPDPSESLPKMQALADYCREKLSAVEGVVLNSAPDALPYIVNFSTMSIRSETMIHYLAERNIFVSGGSACSGNKESPVLTAMGLSRPAILTSIRVSFAQDSTTNDVDTLVNAVAEGMATLASGKL